MESPRQKSPLSAFSVLRPLVYLLCRRRRRCRRRSQQIAKECTKRAVCVKPRRCWPNTKPKPPPKRKPRDRGHGQGKRRWWPKKPRRDAGRHGCREKQAADRIANAAPRRRKRSAPPLSWPRSPPLEKSIEERANDGTQSAVVQQGVAERKGTATSGTAGVRAGIKAKKKLGPGPRFVLGSGEDAGDQKLAFAGAGFAGA